MTSSASNRPSYVVIWVWLLALLFVSLAAVLLPFSQVVTTTFIFIVAFAKAVLVASYYMHLKFEEKLIRSIAIIPVLLFIGMTLTLIPDIVYNR